MDNAEGNKLIHDLESKEAIQHLQLYCSLQKSFFVSNHKYAAAFQELGYPKIVIAEGELVNYSLEVLRGDEENFIIRATSEQDLDGDGKPSVWEIDETCETREITPR